MPDFMYELQPNTSEVVVYWNTVDVIQTNEDLLYDTSAIVAAVGGSMGLFLGFSCYDLAKRALNVAFDE